LLARDPMGVCPLYWGHDVHGRLCVASEMKALVGVCADVAPFPPGHVYDSADGELRRYYHKPWRNYAHTQGHEVAPPALRKAFEQAVHRQLMTDVPYGVLLSGGLDSSLVAACAAQFARERVEDDDRSEAWWPRLHSFAIGLDGSPDLAAAQVAADALGTVHHGFIYTFWEGLDALPEVIRHIETYDVTTIRAATPMYLLARRIKAMGAWGVEARVPFLDLEFIDVAMSIDAKHKMAGQGRIEKAVLREAFDGALPDAILWRQKEQFSDGVGYGWIDGLKAHAEQAVTDREFAAAAPRYPFNTPATKEAYLYRRIFEQHYPGEACAATVPGGKTIACSSPAALAWDPAFANAADPSGRAVK